MISHLVRAFDADLMAEFVLYTYKSGYIYVSISIIIDSETVTFEPKRENILPY